MALNGGSSTQHRAALLDYLCAISSGVGTDAFNPPTLDSSTTSRQSIRIYDSRAVTANDYAATGVEFFVSRKYDSIRKWVGVPIGTSLPLGAVMQKEYPIPVIAAEQVRVEPSLAANYSLARIVGGYVTMKSTSTSTTSASLAGDLSGASLTDSRDNGAYSVVGMAVDSSKAKDSIYNVPCQDGIRAVVGPDLTQRYHPVVEQGDCDSNGAVNLLTTTHVIPGGQTHFFSHFSTLPGADNNVILPELNRFGKVLIGGRLRRTGGGAGNTVDIRFSYIMASHDSTAALTEVQDTVTLDCPNANQTYPFEIDVYSFLSTQLDKNAIFNHIRIITDASIEVQLKYIKSVNLAGPGELGSLRVLRADNVGVGQNITISGELSVEALVTGGLASFVKTFSTYSTVPMDFYRLAIALFNSENPYFRRVVPGTAALDHDRVQRGLAWVNDTGSMAGDAAGLLGTLRGLLATRVPMFRTPLAGAISMAGDKMIDNYIEGGKAAGFPGYAAGGRKHSRSGFDL